MTAAFAINGRGFDAARVDNLEHEDAGMMSAFEVNLRQAPAPGTRDPSQPVSS